MEHDAEYEVAETRTRNAREEIREGEPLPDWTLEEWVNALTTKLGEAAFHAGAYRGSIHGPPVNAHRMHFMRCMEALAAIAQDAWVATQERRTPS